MSHERILGNVPSVRMREPIHIEVWIASKLLSQKSKTFSKTDLVNKIKELFNDTRSGISTHISSYCVASTKADPGGAFRYLTRVSRDQYCLFKAGDEVHESKKDAPLNPDGYDIPPQYQFLFVRTPLYCPECGADNEKNATHCTKCRAPLRTRARPMPAHSVLITEGRQEEVSEEYLMSKEFLLWLRFSPVWRTLILLKGTPVSVDFLTVFRNLGPKALTEDLEFLKSHKLVEQTPKGWNITDMGVSARARARGLEGQYS